MEFKGDHMARVATFNQWMEQCGFQVNGVKIGRVQSDGERGVIASHNLPEGHRIFRIPCNVLLHAENIAIHHDISDANFSGWLSLVVALLYEFHVQGSSSKWKAYFDILPTSFSLPLHKLVAPFFSRVVSDPDICSTISLASFLRFSAVVSAYSFTLDRPNGGQMTACVPMADMLNATTTGTNANLFYHDDGGLEMETIMAISEGMELLNTYRLRPNSELLLRYGYIDTPNPYDDTGLLERELRAQMRCLDECRLVIRMRSLRKKGRAVSVGGERFEKPFHCGERIIAGRDALRAVKCGVSARAVRQVIEGRLAGLREADSIDAKGRGGSRKLAKYAREVRRKDSLRLLAVLRALEQEGLGSK